VQQEFWFKGPVTPPGRWPVEMVGYVPAGFTVEASDAAMAWPLREGVLEPYRRTVAAGELPVGATLFPLPFLAC